MGILIRDQVTITKPIRVNVGVDRLTSDVKTAEIIDEVVAEFWVDEGAELELEPWVEHGVRYLGWKIVRRAASHVVPEIEGEIRDVQWHQIADDMAQAVRNGNVQAALDIHETAALQQAMLAEQTEPQRPGEHEHEWPADLDSDAVCTVPGCGLRYGDWSEQS